MSRSVQALVSVQLPVTPDLDTTLDSNANVALTVQPQHLPSLATPLDIPAVQPEIPAITIDIPAVKPNAFAIQPEDPPLVPEEGQDKSASDTRVTPEDVGEKGTSEIGSVDETVVVNELVDVRDADWPDLGKSFTDFMTLVMFSTITLTPFFDLGAEPVLRLEPPRAGKEFYSKDVGLNYIREVARHQGYGIAKLTSKGPRGVRHQQ